jgi:hemerythrin
MPQYIDWSDEYLIGLKEIDAQHKRLTLLVNQVLEKCYQHQPKEQTLSGMETLLSYTKWHFQTEDALMQVFGYEESKEHRKEHGGLIKGLIKTQKNFESNPIASQKLYPFYFAWFGGHAFSADREMALYIKQIITATEIPPHQ